MREFFGKFTSKKASLKRPLFVACVAGIAVLLMINFFQKNSKPDERPFVYSDESSIRGVIDSNNLNYPKRVSAELPVYIKIPKIKVDTALEYVGLTPDGIMDIPKSPDSVAWFSLGARPGEIGSAVLSGHYGWKNGIQAVFDNLHKLRSGDKIYVEDEKGAIIVFVVREIRKYGQKAYAADVFNSNDGKVHLNLVTCEGAWNKAEKSYSDRLVVFADKEI